MKNVIFITLLLFNCLHVISGNELPMNDLEQLKSQNKNNTQVANPRSIDMVYVQGGTFTMGCTPEQGNDCSDDEKPPHHVTVSDFYIGKYEVTQAQWKAVMGSNPSFFINDNSPVEQVSWNDVQEFINKLNERTGKQFRLPTAAEWEFAARGGNLSKGYKYSGSNNADSVAWDWDNSNKETHPVGIKLPNELGTYDMSGNVYEWCSDWYSKSTDEDQTNPQGPSSGTYRTFCGGSWYVDAWFARVSYIGSHSPDTRHNFVGFRLAYSAK